MGDTSKFFVRVRKLKTLIFLSNPVDILRGSGIMLYVNKNTINYIKTQLKTNPTWASRAIVRLWECQTAAEQSSQITAEVNGVGFNSVDSFILTSFAEQVNKGRTLSPKQLAIAFK